MAGLEADKIVFKPMSYDELSISFKRLQRFNNPFKKYDRVYREILIKHLIFPRISLKNFYDFPFGVTSFLAQLIWNTSIQELNPEIKENYAINPYILYEEIKEFSAKEILKKIIFSGGISGYAKPAHFTESDFIFDEDILKDIFEQNGINFESEYLNINCKDKTLDAFSRIYFAVRMNYPINVDGFLKLAEPRKDISKNIKRLIWINNLINQHNLAGKVENLLDNFENIYNQAEIYRENNNSKKPIKLVLLVEGSTEEVLLPIFSSIAGIDFEKNGIELVASGGKNQVAKIYSEIKEEVNLPVFIILDADAESIAEEINKSIRSQDKLHLISEGEFEDILPDDLICRAVNSFYGLTGNIRKEEIHIYESKTDSLTEIWKQKGFGEFKKAEFAQIISENIKTPADLSEEMHKIITNIKEMI